MTNSTTAEPDIAAMRANLPLVPGVGNPAAKIMSAYLQQACGDAGMTNAPARMARP